MKRLITVASIFALSLNPGRALGQFQTNYWLGTNAASASVPANWSLGVLPDPSHVVMFGTGGSNTTALVDTNLNCWDLISSNYTGTLRVQGTRNVTISNNLLYSSGTVSNSPSLTWSVLGNRVILGSHAGTLEVPNTCTISPRSSADSTELWRYLEGAFAGRTNFIQTGSINFSTFGEHAGQGSIGSGFRVRARGGTIIVTNQVQGGLGRLFMMNPSATLTQVVDSTSNGSFISMTSYNGINDNSNIVQNWSQLAGSDVRMIFHIEVRNNESRTHLLTNCTFFPTFLDLVGGGTAGNQSLIVSNATGKLDGVSGSRLTRFDILDSTLTWGISFTYDSGYPTSGSGWTWRNSTITNLWSAGVAPSAAFNLGTVSNVNYIATGASSVNFNNSLKLNNSSLVMMNSTWSFQGASGQVSNGNFSINFNGARFDQIEFAWGYTNRFTSAFVGNTLTLSAGRLLATNAPLTVANLSISNATLIGSSLNIGIGSNSLASLAMSAGTLTVLSNMVVGDCNANVAGNVTMSSGTIFVTNALHSAALDIRNAAFALNGGQLKVDTLVMTNPCGLFISGGGMVAADVILLGPNLDADGDGIPNGYEQAYGLNPLDASDASLDNDGDGFSNLQEYQENTNPSNSSSTPFRITAIERQNNDIRITWLGGVGRTNTLERSNEIATNFAAIFDITNTTSSVTNYLDAGAATNVGAFYYRIRLVP